MMENSQQSCLQTKVRAGIKEIIDNFQNFIVDLSLVGLDDRHVKQSSRPLCTVQAKVTHTQDEKARVNATLIYH